MGKQTVMLTLVCFLFLFVSVSSAQRRDSEPVKLQKITGQLYQILGGSGARGGAYIGDNGVLIIDAKMNKESVEQVLNEIKNVTEKPILYLINTHSDGDHVNGNKFFPRSVTFVAHENCRKEFFVTRDGSQSAWMNPDLLPFIPSITFRDKMDIYLGSKKIELHYFGTGHTTGDAVVYFPEEKTAFIGDLIFMGRPQLIHSYKGGNSFEYIKTIKRMLDSIDAGKYCSGHSEIADRETIMTHLTQIKNMQNKIGKLIKQGRELNEIKNVFNENESRLVEAIFTEIKEGKM